MCFIPVITLKTIAIYWLFQEPIPLVVCFITVITLKTVVSVIMMAVDLVVARRTHQTYNSRKK